MESEAIGKMEVQMLSRMIIRIYFISNDVLFSKVLC